MAYVAELQATVDEVRAVNRPELGRMGERLAEAVTALIEASRWMGATLAKSPDTALAGAQPYLRLFGLTAGGVYLARGALAALRETTPDAPTRIALARYFAENHAVAAASLKDSVMTGGDSTLMLEPEALAG
jgi:hypothetical protein